jgi:flagellar basal-body rod protein FlgC
MKRSGSRHLTHSDNNRVYQAEQDKDNLEVMEIDEPKLVYNPGHPLADENGYVRVSNVNMVEEMVNMMSASRAYDANLSAIDAAKNMAEKAMKI